MYVLLKFTADWKSSIFHLEKDLELTLAFLNMTLADLSVCLFILTAFFWNKKKLLTYHIVEDTTFFWCIIFWLTIKFPSYCAISIKIQNAKEEIQYVGWLKEINVMEYFAYLFLLRFFGKTITNVIRIILRQIQVHPHFFLKKKRVVDI